MGWRSLSRSVTGTRHQRQYVPCQDAGGYRSAGELLWGAIADGAGSAAHSDLGATVAVDSAIAYLAHLETWLLPSEHPQWPTLERAPSPFQARRLFERTVAYVQRKLQEQAQQHSYALQDLDCTLLSFVATPHWLAAMQIGDGFMVVSSPSAPYQLLFRPDKGEFANQTMFVSAATHAADLQTTVLADPPQFICAASDAFERLALQLPAWSPHAGFFKPLEDYLIETSTPDQDDAYIMDFLKSDYLNHQTEDDKTLLLCRYAAQPDSTPIV